jgi:tetratricopeptide (TPR) repeat protein
MATGSASGSPTITDTTAGRYHDLLSRGTIVDRYTVLEKLGAGGMGEVYAVYDAKLDRRVALKLLLGFGNAFEARLVREAQAMARLSHPNVVAVFDTGRVDDRMFVAMEFVQGTTLRTWQKAKDRRWNEVLRAYLEAGRGLAAAHAAGLVHRDFKSDNVLVADGGAVKVTDFGLARALGEPSIREEPPETPASVSEPTPPTPSTTPALETPMTETGAILGTPGYMAPEQYTGEGVDARSDQFAFCVALFDALYGYKPFTGRSTPEIRDATLLGKIREPPKGTSVPARVHRALVRGLSSDRAARYPSMNELLDDLTRDPARRRLVALAAAGAVGIVAVSAVGAARLTASRQAQLCSGSEAETREVWNPEIQQRIERALLATGVPYAADTWRRTRQHIDDYIAQWATAYNQTCEATRIHQTQSEQVMTVRMACLEQRRDEVRALAQVLSDADRTVASKALKASMDLTHVDRCQDVVSLTAVEPEPGDPAARAEIAAIRKELAAVTAAREAGLADASRDRAEPLVARARAVGYGPLLGQVLLAWARAKSDSGAPLDEFVAAGVEAAHLADRGRDDGTRTDAATSLVQWMAEASRFAEAERWSEVGDGALRRSGGDEARREGWFLAMGMLRDHQGRFEEAAAFDREALEAARRAGGKPETVARAQKILAYGLASLGQREEARRLAEEADQTIARTMGEDHPERVDFLMARGYVAGEMGDHRTALELNRQAIALDERVAPDDGQLPTMYNNVCSELFENDECTDALAYCHKAVDSSLRASGPDSVNVSYAYSSTGDALSCLHRYDEAVGAFASSVAIHERTNNEQEPCYVHSLLGIGQARLLAGRAAEAVAPLEKALAVSSAAEGGLALQEADASAVRMALAKALWQSGKRTARIAELARAAADLDDRAGRESAAHEARAWLGEHALTGRD